MRATLLYKLKDENGIVDTEWRIREIENEKQISFAQNKDLVEVVIPEGVTAIPDSAFFECSNLETVILPSSVKSIDEKAFYYCNNLSKITLPEGLVEIGDYAFCRANLNENFSIPNTVTTICQYAFNWAFKNKRRRGCKFAPIFPGQIDLKIPDSVTFIGEGAFSKCSGLRSVVFPKNNTIVMDKMFSECTGLVSVTIPEGVRHICTRAFYGCYNLKEVHLPSTLQSVGEEVFKRQCWISDRDLKRDLEEYMQGANGNIESDKPEN